MTHDSFQSVHQSQIRWKKCSPLYSVEPARRQEKWIQTHLAEIWIFWSIYTWLRTVTEWDLTSDPPISVRTQPGCIAKQRIPSGSSSTAIQRLTMFRALWEGKQEPATPIKSNSWPFNYTQHISWSSEGERWEVQLIYSCFSPKVIDRRSVNSPFMP